MSALRKDDIRSRTWYRSNRIFQQEMLWYFTTREGTVEGPFIDQDVAIARLDAYIRVMASQFAPTHSFDLQPLSDNTDHR